MHFLPDVYVTCEECHGRRYNRETLEVKFKGLSIADVLDMTIEDAEGFFKAVPPIRDKMHMLNEVGLGYVKVGQQATTLAAARRSASSSPRSSAAAAPGRRCTSSTSRPPGCTSRTCASCSRCSSGWSSRATRWW
jgi:excinuclease ABC subunit A